MGTYTFTYTPDRPDQASLTVEFDDKNGQHPFIEHVIEAFEQFLLGVTYQPGSISKYIDRGALDRQLMVYAELASPL